MNATEAIDEPTKAIEEAIEKQDKKKTKTTKQKKPSVTICHTIKGKGFYFAENNPMWHHKNNFTLDEIKNMNECLS